MSIIHKHLSSDQKALRYMTHLLTSNWNDPETCCCATSANHQITWLRVRHKRKKETKERKMRADTDAVAQNMSSARFQTMFGRSWSMPSCPRQVGR